MTRLESYSFFDVKESSFFHRLHSQVRKVVDQNSFLKWNESSFDAIPLCGTSMKKIFTVPLYSIIFIFGIILFLELVALYFYKNPIQVLLS